MAYKPQPVTSGIPSQDDPAIVTQSKPQIVTRIEFQRTIANGVDPIWGSVIKTGTGQTVNQANGTLVLTAGTTANAETILRSTKSYSGGVRLRAKTVLSQRIANNNFFVELVDVIASGAAITIASATSATVTFPTGHGFTTQNVGQSMYLGGYTGTGVLVPNRYAIASISGDAVTFTVAGATAGTGTVEAFGWNYYHLVYNGTVATTSQFDTQRKGWNSGDTAFTTQTTASPGHIAIITGNDMSAIISDQLSSTNAGARATIRASRDENVPDDMNLFMQIRVANGATAPASSTTWTMGYNSVSNYAGQDVVVQDTRQTTNSPIPVDILRSTATVPVSGAVTANAATGTTYNLVTAATTNLVSIKATAGAMYELTISNLTASTIYVKLYNKASAPVVASDVPIMTIPVAAGAFESREFGIVGKRFATGIAIAVTGAAISTDATAVTAGAQINATYA